MAQGGRTRGWIVALIVLAVVPAVVPAQADGPPPGRFDLRPPWSDGPRPTPLDGPWRFVSDLIPVDEAMEDFGAVDVPGSWHLDSDLQPDRFGVGTYEATVVVPDEIAASELVLGVWIQQISAAGRVFWNGREIYEAGRPGRTRQAEVPSWRPQVVVLPDVQPTNVIRVVASNHRDVAAGITSPLLIGPAAELFALQQRQLSGGVFVAGVLAIMGVFHAMLFVLRRKDRPTLWFSLFVLVVSARVLVVDQLPLVQVAGTLSYAMLMRISYLTYALSVGFILGFVRALLPVDVWRMPSVVIQAVAALLALVVLVAPVHLFIQATQFFHPVALAAGVVVVGAMARSIRRRRPSAGLFASGVLVLFAAAIHDILRALSVVSTPMMIPLATLVFVLLEALVLARQHALALQRAEDTTRTLRNINRAVTRFVPQEMLRLMGVSDVTMAQLGQVTELDMPVLFLDIRGFTSISERLGPHESYMFVNRFLGRMGPIIREEGGVVDKYLGDGLFALFPDGATAAVRAALRLRRARSALLHDEGPAATDGIEYGIGIHAGSLMLGTIGETQRMDTSAISDTVNVASRIESLTKAFGVGLAISSAAYRELPDELRVDSRFLGKVPIRGKSDGVSVFELFGGEPETVRAARAATTEQFEHGVIAYFLGNFDDAAHAFRAVLSECGDDGATTRYLQLAEARIAPSVAADATGHVGIELGENERPG